MPYDADAFRCLCHFVLRS